jgi:predicted phage tail protein
VEKKRLLTAAFILALLFSAVAGAQFVDLGMANPNPFPFGEDVPPDARTNPPTITISSTIVTGNNVTINFKASVGESTTAFQSWISKVYYTSDWNQNATDVYQYGNNLDYILRTEFSCKINMTEIPEGKHTVTVYALEGGKYIGDALMHLFNITGFSSVSITIDEFFPSVSVLSLVNKTYQFSDVPLNFTVSEPVSQMAYSLDGKENITISGNTTLPGLPNGNHSVTVYATDEAGNTGASETIYFRVESFPIVPVAVASVTALAIVVAVLLVYYKKRGKKGDKP